MDRRSVLTLGSAAGLAATESLAQDARALSSLDPFAALRWSAGTEGQRRADLGDGHFLNPVLAGDHPDPALLRDSDDYYLTFSSFDAYPGVPIWHSRDLVNWRPLATALRTPIGSVWAPDLSRHGGRYYAYLPARTPSRRSIYVISAEQVEGPWSEPVDLGLTRHIDPTHVSDERGRRWLYLSGGDRVPLRADGLAVDGPVEHVYDPWRYPEDWVVESFSPEGPKLTRRGEWWYLITAVGGTAGPPTGHMVIAARSRSLDGPWEQCPRNPLVRTRSVAEKWWSRGHATLFEGPRGRWWMLYHGYEHGYWTLGRQLLLEPVEWSADGWPVPRGGDLSRPLRKPVDLGQQPQPPGLSDYFTADRLGRGWAFHDPGADEAQRLQWTAQGLVMAGRGRSPADSSPLTCIAGDTSYRLEVDVEIDAGAEGGLLLFYSRRLFVGLGLGAGGLVMHRYGQSRAAGGAAPGQRTLRIRLDNDRNIVTLHTRSAADAPWRKFDVQMEVSGYHHNVAGDFLSLRPALYAAGEGRVRFARFSYEARANAAIRPGP